MNEQTVELVSQLAAKLGTTSEYLWAVLVRQAWIQGWIMAVEYVLTALVVYALWRGRKQVRAGLTWVVDETDLLGILVIIVAAIAGVVWAVSCLFGIADIITAFSNPEYWALNKILSAVPRK